jgi:hypothetical protein
MGLATSIPSETRVFIRGISDHPHGFTFFPRNLITGQPTILPGQFVKSVLLNCQTTTTRSS